MQDMKKALRWDIFLKDDEEGPLPRRSVPLPCRVTQAKRGLSVHVRDALAHTSSSLRLPDYGRFPKFHRGVLARDPGTSKSDIVSKEYSQLICSDLRFSN